MALNEETEAVFKSSRAEKDPVSGNDVPPGSLPEEVRDDIPAQLSEGEYVVPADVLRFYGLKFFEDLRDNAKVELARMDREGRIGGEPVEDDGLTPEEMQEIDVIMMAVGGYATQQPTQSTMSNPYEQQQTMYRQSAPVAMGNTGYNQGGAVRGYAPGGGVTATPPPPQTQAMIDFSQFGAGFSFSPNAQQNLQQIGQPAQPAFTPVKMYAPDGTEVEATTLDEYNNYLSKGYTLAPPAVRVSDDDGFTPTPTETEPKDPTSWADNLDFTDPEALTKDVYAMIEMSKGEKAGMTAAMSSLGLVGAAGAGAYRATGIARANAIANIIEDMYGADAAKDIRTKINETIEDSLFLKNLPDEWIDGDQITAQLKSKYGTDISTIAALSMTPEERRSISSTATSATQGGVYKPQGVDVALGGDDDDPIFSQAVAESQARAAANRAAMQAAQESGASTDNIAELKEAFEAEGGTWATGGR